MRRTQNICLTAIAAATTVFTACGSGGSDDQPVARLVLAPQTLITVQTGEPTRIAVEAFDATGTLLAEPGPVTWLSNDPATITVDADGVVTAHQALGSAQVSASVGDVRSNVVLVVVAEPSSGATLLADEDFLSEVTLVGELPEDPEVSWQMKAVLSKEYAVDSLLISAGDRVLGGRVVSVVAAAGGFETTLDSVPLNVLFQRLRIDESRSLSVTSSRSASLISSSNSSLGSSASAVMIGPLDCMVGAGASVTDLQFNLVPRHNVTNLNVSLLMAVDNNVTTEFEALVTGPLSVGASGNIAIPLSFNADIDCRTKLIVVPLLAKTGVLALVSPEAFVTLGVGLAGVASSVGARVILDGDIYASVRAGFKLDSATNKIELIREGEVDDQLRVGFEFEDGLADSSIAQITPKASIGLGSQVSLGAGDLSKEFEIAEWKGEIARHLSFATVNGQIQNTGFAAADSRDLTISYTIYEYGLGLMFGWMPGLLPALKVVLLELKGIVNLLSTLGFELPNNVFSLGSSPTGVVSGPEQVELPKTADMIITLNNVDALGSYDVREIQIYRYEGEGTALSSELVASIEPSSEGQTEFIWSFDSSVQGLGTQKYAAFVVTEASPLTPFELSADSTKTIEVVEAIGNVPAVEYVFGSYSMNFANCDVEVLRNGEPDVRDYESDELPGRQFTDLQTSQMLSCSATAGGSGATGRANGVVTVGSSVSLQGNNVSRVDLTTAVTGDVSIQGQSAGNSRNLSAGFYHHGGSSIRLMVNETSVVRVESGFSSGDGRIAPSVRFSCPGLEMRLNETGVRTATVTAGHVCTIGSSHSVSVSGPSRMEDPLSNFSYPMSHNFDVSVSFTQL